MKRLIDDILHFRTDFSPFLVHLTRNKDGKTANNILKTILRDKVLKASNNPVSDAKFGTITSSSDWDDLKRKKYFGAICFTETPLNEIHCLLEIEYRNIDLEPYGLVFSKDNLKKLGVSPVFYLNNYKDDKDEVIRKLCELLINTEEAAKILPLFANAGIQLTGPQVEKRTSIIDFMWEREWRYPSVYGDLPINRNDVFIGLCPDNEIDDFENLSIEVYGQGISFIDPSRNMKWYATKLIERRRDLGMKHSVV